eukprot:7382192-Prymnesium_polylepis.1
MGLTTAAGVVRRRRKRRRCAATTLYTRLRSMAGEPLPPCADDDGSDMELADAAPYSPAATRLPCARGATTGDIGASARVWRVGAHKGRA